METILDMARMFPQQYAVARKTGHYQIADEGKFMSLFQNFDIDSAAVMQSLTNNDSKAVRSGYKYGHVSPILTLTN